MNDEIKEMGCSVEGCDYTDNYPGMVLHLQEVHQLTEKEALDKVYPKSPGLVEAAKAAGAVEIIDKDNIVLSELADSSTIDKDIVDAFDKAPSTKDIIGTGKIEFHKELPQAEFGHLVGHTFLIHGIMMVEDWDGYYGTSTFGLIMLQLRDGRKVTSLGGGIAIVKQLRRLIQQRRFPVKVTLVQKPGQAGPYYLFE